MENELLYSHWLTTLVNDVPQLTSYNINRCSITLELSHVRAYVESSAHFVMIETECVRVVTVVMLPLPLVKTRRHCKIPQVAGAKREKTAVFRPSIPLARRVCCARSVCIQYAGALWEA